MKKTTEKNNRIVRKYDKILGINVISSSKEKVLMSVKDFVSHNPPGLNSNVKFYIVTPGPEQILNAMNNSALKRAMNSADLPVPDGVGLKLALPRLRIVKGRELFMELTGLARENKWRMFFLGGLDNEAELAAGKLGAAYAKGPRLNTSAEAVTETDRKLEKDAVDKINKFAPHLLFVAFGNPKQEIWIYKNLPKLKIGGAMAVGGTFRYVAGLAPLPPKWMEKLGLEWLWRLFTEPFRLGRIWNAVVIFPFKIFWYRIRDWIGSSEKINEEEDK